MVDWSGLPAPSSFQDWQSWAATLVSYLQSQGGEQPHNFPLWVEDSAKPRDGLPAGAEGDMIRVKSGGVVKLKVFTNGAWEDI